MSTGTCGNISAVLCYLQTLALMYLVTSHSKRCRLDMGYVSPWRVVLTPATSWVQMSWCCSHSHHLQPAQQHVGSWVLCPSSSAPLSLHIPAVWKEDSGTYPHLHGETSLPLQADFRSHYYSGGKSWMQSQEPACQSPLKGRIAGWMSQLSAPLRKVSYSWEWSA